MASSSGHQRAVVFKQPSAEARQSDKYFKTLSEAGFDVEFVSTLSFAFCNAIELRDALSNPASYQGILLTSQRAVDAAVNCFSDNDELERWKAASSRPWNEQCLVCTVGAATSQAAEDKLGLTRCHDEATNASQLADQLLQILSSKQETATSSGSGRPFLFPCGDLRRDVLLTRLTQASHTVAEVVCYQTTPCPTLAQRASQIADQLLSAATAAGPASGKTPNQTQVNTEVTTWLVFFSPSGVSFCTEPLLSKLVAVTEGGGSSSSRSKPSPLIKMAAIGQTTADALRSAGIEPDAVAKKPSAESLLQAITCTEHNL